MSWNELWRFQRVNSYDARDMESANSAQLVKPFFRGCWFVRDSDYRAYDTLVCVGNLKKSMQTGDMMSEGEIRSLQQNKHFGHWEVDCVMGKSEGKKEVLLVFTEGTTRYEMIFKLNAKTSKSVNTTLECLL